MPYTFSSILVSLFITIVAYCIFPLLFAAIRRKEITKKKYTIICFVVNLLIHIVFFSSSSSYSTYPCFLWTLVFTAIGRKILVSKSILLESRSTVEAARDSVDAAILMPDSNNEAPTAPSATSNVQHANPQSKRLIGISAASIGVVLFAVFFVHYMQCQQQLGQLNQLVAELESSQESQAKTIGQLESQIEDNEAEIRLLTQAKSRMTDKISELESEIEFYDRYVVFVRDDNTGWYHKYDCMIFQNTHASFWAYNIDAAISEGFDPCFYCFQE